VFIDLLFQDPVRYATIVGVVIGSIVLHELGHAMAATWEGDATPRIRGHLTWNPVVHMGWFSIGLAAVIGIAWGATPVTPAFFRHRRWGEVIVSFAGPAVNLVLAVVAALVLTFVRMGDAPAFVALFWRVALFYNLALFLLNMIPVPPLDGFSILSSSVDLGGLGHWLRTSQPWPMLLAFAFVVFGPFWTVVRQGADALEGVWRMLLGGGA
jgi:Zn-dependent protease